jgi:uncharacterized membrane protein/nitrite reductase/ring-hydroxylating ferredoxin subunit
MRSKASIKSHPIHPILIAFPVAFFSGTLLFDLLSLLLQNGNLWLVGSYLEIAGVIGALAAAIPGFVDFLYTVPPESSAKKRATQHALLNLLHTAIFLTAWWLRRDGIVSGFAIVGMEIVGVGLMLAAGWLGGTLVYRNQIGVDPRYAHAGKWKEEYHDANGKPVPVAKADELKVNQMKLVHVGGKRVVIGRTENGLVAFDDRCTHRGGSLAGGAMICGTVQCPWHGSQFDVNSGNAKAGPAKQRIAVYQLAEHDGTFYLTL